MAQVRWQNLQMAQKRWHSSYSLAQDSNRSFTLQVSCSSFLILITRFVILEFMKIKSVTPMHHLTIVVSSASRTPPSRYRA